jgi:hypothetical protein
VVGRVEGELSHSYHHNNCLPCAYQHRTPVPFLLTIKRA